MDANFKEDGQDISETTVNFDGSPLIIENLSISRRKHSGSFFEFHQAFDPYNARDVVIGFGKHKINNLGLRCDSVEFAKQCQEDYELLQAIYPMQQFPFLLPKQVIYMGGDLTGRKQTVVCVRELIDISKSIFWFKPRDFRQFPELKEEISNFHSATVEGLRRFNRICDIKQINNLVIDKDGHLRLIDTNNFLS